MALLGSITKKNKSKEVTHEEGPETNIATPSISPSRRTITETISKTCFVLAGISWTTMSSGSASHAAMYDNAPYRDESTNPSIQLPSGVQYEDFRIGTGDAVVTEGKRVNVQWVLKRSNGYLVDSSAQNDGVPFIFTVGSTSSAIMGLDEGIRGMKVGGLRRILIPPQFAYVQGVEDGFGPKQRIRRVMELLKDIPGEYIVLDIKVTRIQ